MNAWSRWVYLELALLAIFGLAVWHLITTQPLAVDTVPVISAEEPLTQIELAPTPYQQAFGTTGESFSGLTLYSQDMSTAPHAARMRIRHKEKKDILAESVARRVLFDRQDSARLLFRFPRLTIPAEEELILEVMAAGPTPIQISANAPSQSGKISIPFSLQYNLPLPASIHSGAIAGMAVLSALVLLHIAFITQRNTSKQFLVAGILAAAIPLLVLLPFAYSLGSWGINDWDYRQSLAHIYRATILEHHQFPFWNPYICGGAAGLGDPEFAVLAPSFIPILLLGPIPGIKTMLFICFAVTGLGIFMLAKRLGLSAMGSLVATLPITLGSALILKAVEGHVTIIYAFMWIPWALWAWVAAYRLQNSKSEYRNPKQSQKTSNKNSKRILNFGHWNFGFVSSFGFNASSFWALVCGIFLALAFLEGGLYILLYTAGAFAFLILLVSRKKEALLATAAAGLWAVGFSGVKLIPTLLWLRQFPDDSYAGSTFTLRYLFELFFGRHLHGSYVLPSQLSGWHEYGTFIGFTVFMFWLLALSRWKQSKLIRGLTIGALLALVASGVGPWWDEFFEYASFLPRSNISRIILFTLLAGSIQAAIGFELLQRKMRQHSLMPLLFVGIMLLELTTLAYPLAEQAFTIPPVIPPPSPAPYPLAFTQETYNTKHGGFETPRAYALTQAGYGTFSFCSVIGPKSSVATIQEGVVPSYVSRGSQTQTRILSWSPNEVTVEYEGNEASAIRINSNYASGWRINGAPATEHGGRVAAAVSGGSGIVQFSYRSPGFFPGLVISMLTVALAISVLRKRKANDAL